MAFMAPAISLVAAAVKPVGVLSGASCLCLRPSVFFVSVLFIESLRLNLNYPPARSDRDGMCPVACAQLSQDVLEVSLYRVFGNKEPLCDIAIPISLDHLAQNVNLAAGELFIAEMFGQL